MPVVLAGLCSDFQSTFSVALLASDNIYQACVLFKLFSRISDESFSWFAFAAISDLKAVMLNSKHVLQLELFVNLFYFSDAIMT